MWRWIWDRKVFSEFWCVIIRNEAWKENLLLQVYNWKRICSYTILLQLPCLDNCRSSQHESLFSLYLLVFFCSGYSKKVDPKLIFYPLRVFNFDFIISSSDLNIHFVTITFHNLGNKNKETFVCTTALMNDCCQAEKSVTKTPTAFLCESI